MSATVNQVVMDAAAPAIASEKEMKSLPLKYKSMHYALISFIQSDTNLDHTMKETLLARLPVYGSVAEQAKYYESYDMKSIEKDIVKPMIKKQKDDEKAKAKEEAKNAAKLAKKEEKEKSKVVPKAPKEQKAPKAPKAPKEKKEVVEEPVKGPELQVPELAQLAIDNTPEMVEEPYVKERPSTPVMKKTNQKNPNAPKKTVKPRAKKEKVSPIPINTELAPPTAQNNEIEQCMFKVNGVRYWTPDEHFQNGPVFENATDEDGDPAPGIKQVGKYVNGTLEWIKTKK